MEPLKQEQRKQLLKRLSQDELEEYERLLSARMNFGDPTIGGASGAGTILREKWESRLRELRIKIEKRTWWSKMLDWFSR
jgi:hypothetical protein